jgi:hypothetical protein
MCGFRQYFSHTVKVDARPLLLLLWLLRILPEGPGVPPLGNTAVTGSVFNKRDAGALIKRYDGQQAEERHREAQPDHILSFNSVVRLR